MLTRLSRIAHLATAGPNSRSRWYLRRVLQGPHERHGYRRSLDRTSVALAESILRTRHRLDTPRMFESLDRAERKTSASNLDRLLRLLSQFQVSSFAGSQLANATRGGTAVAGRGHLHSAGRRIASPILACCVIVNIGLPGWFAAAGLRLTVKQPNSRGIPGFFLAIFSVVTQFDVCPVGWYNCRMEFLGRTAPLRPPRV